MCSYLLPQVLDCLEYIHSRGFTHNDVKAANLLQGPEPASWYLVDFGLVVKFQKGEELAHKEYRADPRKAHDGTIEYLSRDAHIGCTARRSDLENLALCLIHWSSGALPWLHLIKGPPAKVQAAKEQFFKELPGSAEHLPAPVKELLLYVAELQFEEAPDYSRCRGMFTAAAKEKGAKVAAKAKQGTKNVAAAPKKSGANGFHVEDKSEVSEEEEDDDDEIYSPSPVKKGKKPVVKKVVKSPVVKNVVKSPVKKRGKSPAKMVKSPAKMVKSPAKKSTQTADTDSDSDMFATSPPAAPLAAAKQYSSSSSQTSPAFVAASKAARREGRQALARVEGGKVATPAKSTPK